MDAEQYICQYGGKGVQSAPLPDKNAKNWKEVRENWDKNCKQVEKI